MWQVVQTGLILRSFAHSEEVAEKHRGMPDVAYNGAAVAGVIADINQAVGHPVGVPQQPALQIGQSWRTDWPFP